MNTTANRVARAIETRVPACAALAVAALGFALAVAPSALAVPGHILGGSFGGPGTLPGKFAMPVGIAVSQTSHEVLVSDRDNGRVQRFSANGAFLSSFDGSGTPGGSMSPGAVAVDGSSGDVYVADTASPVVNRFAADGTYLSQIATTAGPADGLAVDPINGDVYVSDFFAGGVSVFDSTGAPKLVISGAGTDGQIGVPGALAVDGAGNVYVADSDFAGTAVVKRFTTAGEYLSTTHVDATAQNQAVDPVSGDLFVLENGAQSGAQLQVLHYDAAGVRQFLFGMGEISFPATNQWPLAPGVAVDHDSGRVYAVDQGQSKVAYFDAITLPDVSTSTASNEGTTTATVSGAIDPLGIPTTYRFDYGLTQAYGASTPDADAGAGTGSLPVDAALSDLQPSQTYHYRLVGANASGVNAGEDRTFVTLAAPPSFGDAGPSASNVRAGNARIHAAVNPNNRPTTYYFEYGEVDGVFGSSTATTEVGSGFGNVEVSQLITGLEPDTTYYFRVVADNGIGAPVQGATGTFTTALASSNVAIQPVTDTTATAAELHALADTKGLDGSYRFSVEGLDNAYSSLTPDAPLTASAEPQALSAVVSGLPSGSRFRARAIVTTSAGSMQSEVAEFETLPVRFQQAPDNNPAGSGYGCDAPRLGSPSGSVRAGQRLTLTGTDLGVFGSVKVGTRRAEVLAYGPSAVTIVVPAAAAGRQLVTIDCGRQSSTILAVAKRRSNRFSLSAATDGLRAVVRLGLPSSGRLSVTGRHLVGVRKTIRGKGKTTVLLRLSDAGRRRLALADSRRLVVSVRARFTPSDGGSRTVTKTVTFKRKGGR